MFKVWLFQLEAFFIVKEKAWVYMRMCFQKKKKKQAPNIADHKSFIRTYKMPLRFN